MNNKVFVIDSDDNLIFDSFCIENFEIYYLNDAYGPYKQIQFFDIDDNFICAYRFKYISIELDKIYLTC